MGLIRSDAIDLAIHSLSTLYHEAHSKTDNITAR